MKKFFIKSITFQIAIFMVLLSLVPLGGVAWYINKQKSSEIWESQIRNMNLLYRKTIEQIETTVDYQKDLIKYISQNPKFIDEFSKGLESGEISDEFTKYLNVLIQQKDYYDFLFITPSGRIFYTVKKEGDFGKNINSRAFRDTSLAFAFRETNMFLEISMSNLRYYEPSNAPAAFISAPIIGESGYLGVLAVQLKEEFLFSLVNSNEGFGKSGEIVAGELRGDGAIVATIPLKYDKDAFLYQRVLNLDDRGSGISKAVLGEYGVGEIVDYRGVLSIALWGYVPSLRWGVVIKSDKEELYAPLKQSNQRLITLMLILALLIGITVYFATKKITKPILKLVDSVQKFKRGEKRVIEPIKSDDEIGLLSEEFNSMSEEIDMQLEILQEQAVSLEEQAATLEEQSDEIERQNRNLERQVDERTEELKVRSEKIRALLNNSGQGFLSFGLDLKVDGEYSQECANIFEKEIDGCDISMLLYQSSCDEQNRNSLKKALRLFFNSNISFQRETILSLIDGELKIGNKWVRMSFRELDNKKAMLILTDITEQRMLEKKVKEERDLLNFITLVLRDKSLFLDNIEEFENYLENLLENLRVSSELELFDAIKIYRKIHTYKGIFLQFSLPNLPSELHDFESLLWKKILNRQNKNEKIILHSASLDSIIGAKNEDINSLRLNLGSKFLETKNDVVLPSRYLNSLEKFANRVKNIIDIDFADEITKEGIEIINKLRFTSIRELLSIYPNLAKQLAYRLNKEIEEFEIDGDDILVDPRRVGSFTKSLVHIFRNALDHGIETPEERAAALKSEVGKIRCKVLSRGSDIVIELSDDGRGIDLEVIKKRAKERGLYESFENMKRGEILRIIFEDGFTTKDDVSDISGRGVGLSALKDEVEELGGRIEIESTKGVGSTFRFIIPKES